MKKLTTTLCLTIAVFLGSIRNSESVNLQKGYAAYKKGDYGTALKEWIPLPSFIIQSYF
jgi:hypothetical protein